MQKFKISFNYSIVFVKLNKNHLPEQETKIAETIKDYKEFLTTKTKKTKKCFEIELRLINKEDDLTKLTKEFHNYLTQNLNQI